MFLCSLIEELCRKEESDKTGSNFNFGHECIISVMVSKSDSVSVSSFVIPGFTINF